MLNECIICLNNINENDQIIITECCANNFHKNCLYMWLNNSNNCPLCRNIINVVNNNIFNNTNKSSIDNIEISILLYYFHILVLICFISIIIITSFILLIPYYYNY